MKALGNIWKKISLKMKNKIDLFILTARRIELFKITISSFVEKNKNQLDLFNKIWILDDRSSWEDRQEMFQICSDLFGDKVYLVCFNSEREFGWIDKFNSIAKLAETDFVFVLEDDWKCLETIEFEKHIIIFEALPELTQIAFCDPLWIQPDELKSKYNQSAKYWKNPWPGEFRHINNKVERGWSWVNVRMKHYTNNPSITRTSVFKSQKFIYDRSFEHKFADGQKDPLQFFTSDIFFQHLGFDQALEKTK
jgi:hypothetical protein